LQHHGQGARPLGQSHKSQIGFGENRTLPCHSILSRTIIPPFRKSKRHCS
jgi:hypothetical protein